MVCRFRMLAILTSCACAVDETSLMQRVKPVEIKHKDTSSVSNLLETAGNLLKNGATTDVVVFANETLAEISGIVIPAMNSAHLSDQAALDNHFAEFETALSDLEEGIARVNQRNLEERRHSDAHKMCREEEDAKCTLKKTCDYDIYARWGHFIEEERELRTIEEEIKRHFCVQVINGVSVLKNGTEPAFRDQAEPHMESFKSQWSVVKETEAHYDEKHPDCEHKFTQLDDKTEECDAHQSNLENAACAHATEVKEVREQFSCAWHTAYDNYAETVRHARVMQADRIKEYRALTTVACLLHNTTERNGRPCDESTGESDAVVTGCEAVGLEVDIFHYILEYKEVESFPPNCVDADGDNLVDVARCFPVPPHYPCTTGYLHQEYNLLPAVPQPEYHSENTHCNLRPDCQACTLGAEELCLPYPPAGPIPGEVDDIACCEAVSLDCVACQAGLSESDYCARHPHSSLCPEDDTPPPCCRANSLECLACAAELTEEEYCLQNPQSELCLDSRGPVQKSWDNHFAAFAGQDVAQILLDYTDKSEIRVYDQTSGSLDVFTGLAGVQECFTGLFARLFDTNDLAAPVIDVHEATSDQPGSVFLIWRSPISGFLEATDSFIFDNDAKILRQNVVVTDTRSSKNDFPKNQLVPSGSGAVHDGWSNHFAAFGNQDVTSVKLDYTEESVIVVYNQANGEQSVFEGLDGVEECFTGLFHSLHDISNLAAPIQHVEEGDTAQVFLTWRAPASGYQTGTDTFIFNPEGKILRQNVVVHYTPVQAAWENHFAAFGGQDIDRILVDYTENSEIRMYDQTSGSLKVYTGLAGVRDCFTDLFARLTDTSDLTAPVIDVHEATPNHPGSVFLIWSCPASGYAEATDSFIFDQNAKILRQNVVVTDTQADTNEFPKDEVVPTGSGAVHDGWANHFAAFGGQDVPKVKLDYTEESVIVVYNQVTGEKSTFEGLSGVENCFAGLFDSLYDTSDLSAPIQHVEEGENSQVFLTWRAPASGYKTGTDTFIFNREGKILRQNVVVHHDPDTGPVGHSWSNHFDAFAKQNIEQILEDYTENSEIRVYDQTSGILNVYTGKDGVRDCFTTLFDRLFDTSDLTAPVIDVHEATSNQPGSVFLIWSCPASGYAEATDTFIFDENAKILRQNVVLTDTQADINEYPKDTLVPSGEGAVHNGWANHFEAFGGKNVPMVKFDYSEESVIVVYNQVTGEKSVFAGLSGVENCFAGLFSSLYDTSDLGAPIQHVEEGGSAQVFLTWRAPASGYLTGTDTFIFNPEGKILRQNVVVHYSPLPPVEPMRLQYALPNNDGSPGNGGRCVSLNQGVKEHHNFGCDADGSCSGHEASDATLQDCDPLSLAQRFQHRDNGQIVSALGNNLCLEVSMSTHDQICEPLTLRPCVMGQKRQQFEEEVSHTTDTVWRNVATGLAIHSDAYSNEPNNWILACPGTCGAKHFRPLPVPQQ